ncbi:exocyst complex component sec3a-like protein [Trifolium pratense]|uniref:Exocyst complex component sec3a-like protein n=1 Tax=Trifolium pratense TaxID=57577 RepID=A0A2K3NL76_TRIPR|nr:exocyst complex component sec3a-like protein [Trifolium pratense]
MQSVNNKSLIEELDKLLEQLNIPPEYSAFLTGDSFDEAQMLQNEEACEWLIGALRGFQASTIDPAYVKMRAFKEKRGELQIIKSIFVTKVSEFLRNYFATFVDFLMNDKSYFSQRGQLKRPDHSDLRYKCRTYARLLQHLKVLDKNCLGPLKKAYCCSLNLLLRREVREFANELRAESKTSPGPGQNVNSADSSAVSDAYAKMLTVFIPLMVDESSFFAHFMCFEAPPLDGNKSGHNDDANDDDDLGIADIDENDNMSPAELAALNESLQDLLDGIQEDFYAVVDWACKIDPLCCISMHGITERYLSGQKADASRFVSLMLSELECRISMLFIRYVDDSCHNIEKCERNAKQSVLPYIPRTFEEECSMCVSVGNVLDTVHLKKKCTCFVIVSVFLSVLDRFATLATKMEQYIAGQSRDLVDQAYMKFVSIMFVTLERLAQTEPKYADIFLIENYAAFQNSLYDLANVVPTLAKFYHQASEAYEQSCSRHISMIIYYQFERLFQFARRIEDLILNNVSPEEIPFQLGLSKVDFRKMLKSSLSGMDRSIGAMYKKLQKNLTSEELLPSLWDKCKKDFVDKYDSFVQLVAKIYPAESVPTTAELRELLAKM